MRPDEKGKNRQRVLVAETGGRKIHIVIRVCDYRSRFCTEPHLNLWIEGEPLQEWLRRLVPEAEVDGLVPAWLDWLIDEREQEIVRKRIWPKVGSTQRVPILICPDDLDFSCAVVIAEVSSTEEEVVWERLGLDATPWKNVGEIGREVNWFSIPSKRFPRDGYLECVERFRAVWRSL